jgi:uncharacterized protein YgiM (DUF1202 family)
VLTVEVIGNGINVRSQPSRSAGVLGRVSSPSRFEVTDIEESGGFVWYEIRYANSRGYLRSDVVKVFMVVGGRREVTLTPSPTPTGGAVGNVRCSSNWNENTLLMVVYPAGITRVDLRSQPRGTSASVAFLENGSRVVVRGKPQSDGRQCWYPVRINGTGTNGWVEEGSIR